MTSFKPVTIPTDRLILRLLGEADLPALFDLYAHPEVMRYMSWPAWTDLSQAQKFLAEVQDDYRNGSALQLGIEQRANKEIVGIVSLHRFHIPSRRAEIGYALRRWYWGSGYMHEALVATINYGFDSLDLNRIEADIDPRNGASARVLERLGFQKEGHLRERWIVNGEVSDTWMYGLLQREWRKVTQGDTETG